jgi:hypothetical protein
MRARHRTKPPSCQTLVKEGEKGSYILKPAACVGWRWNRSSRAAQIERVGFRQHLSRKRTLEFRVQMRPSMPQLYHQRVQMTPATSSPAPARCRRQVPSLLRCDKRGSLEYPVYVERLQVCEKMCVIKQMLPICGLEAACKRVASVSVHDTTSHHLSTPSCIAWRRGLGSPPFFATPTPHSD